MMRNYQPAACTVRRCLNCGQRYSAPANSDLFCVTCFQRLKFKRRPWYQWRLSTCMLVSCLLGAILAANNSPRLFSTNEPLDSIVNICCHSEDSAPYDKLY